MKRPRCRRGRLKCRRLQMVVGSSFTCTTSFAPATLSGPPASLALEHRDLPQSRPEHSRRSAPEEAAVLRIAEIRTRSPPRRQRPGFPRIPAESLARIQVPSPGLFVLDGAMTTVNHIPPPPSATSPLGTARRGAGQDFGPAHPRTGGHGLALLRATHPGLDGPGGHRRGRRTVRARQRERRVPAGASQWVAEVTPGLREVVEATGLYTRIP